LLERFGKLGAGWTGASGRYITGGQSKPVLLRQAKNCTI
jgi:hypothetical protein